MGTHAASRAAPLAALLAGCGMGMEPPAGVVEGRFATAEACAECHASSEFSPALRDEAGRSVAPYDLWRSSMMANAARDPVFRAAVSVEVAETPAARDAIEAKCLGCHAPMAMTEARLEGEPLPGLALLGAPGHRGQLARDGVSCTLCHQIRPDGLGTEASFSAGFVIGDDATIYGPHRAPLARPMEHRSGYTPAYGAHVRESALCGSCHTLFTEALAPDGAHTGDRMLEQGPYLEWRNSAYSTESGGARAASCQSCHVPTTSEDGVPLRTRIARSPGGMGFQVEERSPVGRHVFVGANTLVPALLRDHAELGATAPPAAFDATIAAARESLAGAARLEVEAERRDGRLEATVRVENLVGHKLPTAYPARRMWLRLAVRDGSGAEVFVTGDVDAAGRILGADGAPLPSEHAGGPHEPHRDLLAAPGEVQLWETVLADGDGAPTHQLLRGAGYAKDDRILPAGWRADGPHAGETAPAGVDGDPDFVAGSDQVRLSIPLPGEGPLRLEATLLYQSLSARHAAELLAHDTPEVARLARLLDGTALGLEPMARTEVEVP